jgi:ribulose-phosphate 3-epimerase
LSFSFSALHFSKINGVFQVSTKKIEIAPSILSADFRNLEREVKAVQDSGADRIHCDIMDGHFVPNLTFGPIVVEAVKRCVTIPLDVHLMIHHPQKYISQFCDAGADILMVHAEACDDLPAVLESIRKKGIRSGVAVNPDKSIDLFLPYLDMIDQVLIMTVYAGFGGQKFIPEMMDKVKRVAAMIAGKYTHIDIEVDGGVNKETAKICIDSGVNVLVAGSYVFGGNDYSQQIASLRQ